MDSLHEIPVAAPAKKVFQAWTTAEGLKAWWTTDVSTPTAKKKGDKGEYVFRFGGGSVAFHFAVKKEVAGKRVVWRGVKGKGMPKEWVGTKIDVHISKGKGGGTRLQFAHRDWKNAKGAYCECNTTWGELMYRLKGWCEGKGRGALFGG
jgi:uncharacterized protein YndB with AHSA1/START domain